VRDIDVRTALIEALERQHASEPDTKLKPEMGLSGGHVRIDVAVLNGFMHGYEIKSDRDTLERLPNQVDYYSDTLDYATIVVGQRYRDKIETMVPAWWGITVATPGPEGVILREDRAATFNPGIDAYSVACLLWKDEALTFLDELGLAKGFRSKPREALYQRLAAMVPLDQLREWVRQRLKSREAW
jgi:hypothetical protein